MTIFNSYVKLPEGILLDFEFHKKSQHPTLWGSFCATIRSIRRSSCWVQQVFLQFFTSVIMLSHLNGLMSIDEWHEPKNACFRPPNQFVAVLMCRRRESRRRVERSWLSSRCIMIFRHHPCRWCDPMCWISVAVQVWSKKGNSQLNGSNKYNILYIS